MNARNIEILVGLFVTLGVAAFLVLALKVANAGLAGSDETFTLKAKFDNIGSLKVRAPVKVGGVVIGRVANIYVDQRDFSPVVLMDISSEYDKKFSDTTSVSILTSGILGEQYLGINPIVASSNTDLEAELFGVTSKPLSDGDFITDTKSALVLEELIGQFLFNQGSE